MMPIFIFNCSFVIVILLRESTSATGTGQTLLHMIDVKLKPILVAINILYFF
jgi:hypothetical protein